MTTPCLTDYISIDNLQTFLDESSQQDGIALRLWFPQNIDESGIGWISKSWNNACLFHKLIRTYPSGERLCNQYFKQKAAEVIANEKTQWHTKVCPTSLYVFGWPIYDKEKQILAILFGGLVRDPIEKNNSNEWSKVKEALKEDRAVLQELENEYYYAPEFTKKERKHLFSKWKLFCQLLSSHFTKGIPLQSDDEYWMEWLISIHSCTTIAMNLTKIKKVKKHSLQLTITEKSVDHQRKDHYYLQINNCVQLRVVENNTEEAPKQFIPVCRSNRICLSFDKKTIKCNGKGFYWKISKNIISGILIDNGHKNITHAKLLLERQTHVFKEVSKKAVTNLENMITELFDQLRKVGIISIDFASFSEVIYFSNEEKNTKPHFKARVTYPNKEWSKKQCNVIDKLDLYADNPISQGSTVLAFQQSRPVLDRNVKKSSTYVIAQPDVRSSFVIPINYGPLALGVITFDSVKNNYFNIERKQQLENLTQLISPVIYHKKFQETLQNLNQNIEHSAREFINGSKQKIRKYTLSALCSIVQAEAASYWEQDSKDETILYRDTSIGRVDNFNRIMPIDNSTLGDLFKKKLQFVLVGNIKEELENNSHSKSLNKRRLNSFNYLRNENIHSYLAFPVEISGKRVILSFYRFVHTPLRHREFSTTELDITKRLGEIFSFYESLNKVFESQKRELEIQLKSSEELAITLAHNIKSPLSSTYARLDDLERTLKGTIGEDFKTGNYRSLFDAIKSNFFTIKRSTSPMLKHLALQENYNYGVYSVQAFHIYYDILSRQISLVRRGMKIEEKLEKRKVEFSGHRQFPLLYGDKTAIGDMISNLLENAVKYSEAESKIYIETNFDYVSREIQVYIKNEGKIFIPDEDIDRIFEYAYRAEIARDKDPSSTGVGLYYSRFIAKQHGATLTVVKVSNPVTFKLVIPTKLLYSVKKAEETLKANNENQRNK